MTFEQWLVEIENIPYYNFLTEEEWELLQEKYKNFIKRKVILYLYRSILYVM